MELLQEFKGFLQENQEITVGSKKIFAHGIVFFMTIPMLPHSKPAGHYVSTDFETEFTVHSALKQYYYPKNCPCRPSIRSRDFRSSLCFYESL
jgi:hypothetical protein